MSAELPLSSNTRALTDEERRLIRALLRRVPDYKAPDWLTTAQVVPLTALRIGSLRFVHSTSSAEEQRFGRTIAEMSFSDRDGVLVSVALYVDQHDQPFELDVWKVDFSAVAEVPSDF